MVSNKNMDKVTQLEGDRQGKGSIEAPVNSKSMVVKVIQAHGSRVWSESNRVTESNWTYLKSDMCHSYCRLLLKDYHRVLKECSKTKDCFVHLCIWAFQR